MNAPFPATLDAAVAAVPSTQPAPGPAAAPLFAARGVARHFAVKGGTLHAVDGVDFTIHAGESVGLVGESGCGKSTLVRLVARLLDVTTGTLALDGTDLAHTPARRFAADARRGAVQMVFQDPTDSLNPRFTARDAIADPLRHLTNLRGPELVRRVDELADDVGLPRELLGRFPHQLSGGQKARVGIARAIACRPRLLVLDEPTAALDVSVQALVLHLLADLRARTGMSYLFVTHDLNVVRMMCERVLVMYLGRIVESGPVEAVFRAPAHPYTRALVAAIPDPMRRERPPRIEGEPRTPIDPDPRICRFDGRCPQATPRCREVAPLLRPAGPGREVACHHADV